MTTTTATNNNNTKVDHSCVAYRPAVNYQQCQISIGTISATVTLSNFNT